MGVQSLSTLATLCMEGDTKGSHSNNSKIDFTSTKKTNTAVTRESYGV